MPCGPDVELIRSSSEGNVNTVELKLLGDVSTKVLLQAVMPHIELISLNEMIPSMNDIFIHAVNQYKEKSKDA